MRLTSEQVEWALYAARDLVDRLKVTRRHVPAELLSLYQKLEMHSACGSESDSDAEELDPDELIDSGAAAEILGCSTRWVRTIRTDLDGRKVSGHWVFRRQDVIDYTEARGVTTNDCCA